MESNYVKKQNEYTSKNKAFIEKEDQESKAIAKQFQKGVKSSKKFK